MMKKEFELVRRADFIRRACAGKKVLHLGCTNYPFTEQSLRDKSLLHFDIQAVAEDIYGFDFDQKGIDILESAGAKNLYRADLEKLEDVALDETFDVIIAGEMIEHLSNPGLFLRGIRRFMRADTDLIITTINAYGALRFFIYGLRGQGGRNEPVHPDHVAYYSYKTLSMVIERENLRVKEFLFYDIGAEHRRYNRRLFNFINDAAIRFSPQLCDGVIAVCGRADA